MGFTEPYPCCLELMKWTSDKFSSPLPSNVLDRDFAVTYGSLVLDLHFCLKKVLFQKVLFSTTEHPLMSSWSPNIPSIWLGVYVERSIEVGDLGWNVESACLGTWTVYRYVILSDTWPVSRCLPEFSRYSVLSSWTSASPPNLYPLTNSHTRLIIPIFSERPCPLREPCSKQLCTYPGHTVCQNPVPSIKKMAHAPGKYQVEN